MFQITLLAMGKLKENSISPPLRSMARLSGVCRFQLLELPECRLPESPSRLKLPWGWPRRGSSFVRKLPKGAWFCVLTRRRS